MERVIYQRLLFHTHATQTFDKRQFGFQKGVSAEHAAYKLANDIVTNFKCRKETVAVFCDVVNAFPAMWCEGLIHQLREMKIPEVYVKWIRSYLENRTARVEIHHAHTVEKTLNRGAPQGSILGPYLFSCFAAGIFDIADQEGCQIVAYADDWVIIHHPLLTQTKGR